MSGKMFNNHLVSQPSFQQRDNHFSQGLRVLAIDDNVVCLRVLAFELQKCGYQVTATTKAAEAIEILRKNKDSYDIVITDVMRSDMDVFELLEIIGLEMDIPVIMTSANNDLEVIEKGVMHGARDYLVKPVGLEILKNIWQHVIRKTTYNPLPAQRIEANRAIRIPAQQIEANMESRVPAQKMEANTAIRRSARVLNKKNHAVEDGQAVQSHDAPPLLEHKKARVTWTPELHAKFVAAVQQLGQEAVPKKILKLMNEPHLTRENVASHLQKYRNAALKQKEDARQEIEYHCDANMRRHLDDTTNIRASSSKNQRFHAVNHPNSSTAYGRYNLRSQNNPSLLPLNHQSDLFLQQNVGLVPSHSRDMNHIRQQVLTPAPLLTIYPDVQPDFNSIEYHPIQYGRNNNTIIDSEQVSLQIPLSGAIQTSASHHSSFLNTLRGESIKEIVTCPLAPGALINHIGNANHMGRDPKGQATSLPGHHEARTCVAYNGNGGTDSRGKAGTTGLVLDMQAQVDGLIGGDEHINYMQFFNGSDVDVHGHQRNDSLDDELRSIVGQFSRDAAPTI